jgi:hypothetical protein
MDVLAVLAVVPNRKAKPSFVAQALAVEQGLVVAGVPDLLVVRKTITQSKAGWLRASLVNLSARVVSKAIARRS